MSGKVDGHERAVTINALRNSVSEGVLYLMLRIADLLKASSLAIAVWVNAA
jgi:hypothetical protein